MSARANLQGLVVATVVGIVSGVYIWKPLLEQQKLDREFKGKHGEEASKILNDATTKTATKSPENADGKGQS
ncbi:uncharacterized protein J3D65DRAFT_608367 [Phyllosticta citribraziliensis]|uniref:Uncharacterized protein n=1 Tax=Phyllosticta citribraziliensis TaxID=989973 RepID=A0ABR1M860_9PEZI